MLRRSALLISTFLLVLTVGCGVLSIWHHVTWQIAHKEERHLVYVVFKPGLVTAGWQRGWYTSGGDRSSHWWGSTTHQHTPVNDARWVALPVWEAMVLFAALPACCVARRLLRRRHPAPTTMRWNVRRAWLVTSSLALIATASVSILGFWLTLSVYTGNEHDVAAHGACPFSFGIWADEGWFDIDVQRGELLRERVTMYREWYGALLNVRTPDRALWWLMLPAWEPLLFFSIYPAVVLSRRLRGVPKSKPGELAQPPVSLPPGGESQ